MNPMMQALGWTVLHAFWQGATIALLGWIAAMAFRAAQIRYWIYSSALALILFVAGWTFVAEIRAVTTGGLALAPGTPIEFRMVETPSVNGNRAVEMNAIMERIAPAEVARLCAWLWVTGAGMMSIRALLAAYYLRRLRKTAEPWENSTWRTRLETWREELGIQRAVDICTTVLNDVPAVLGCFKPVILLPATLITRLTPEQLEAVILHELMHVRRNDFLANVLQVLCETLLFFHPAAWWLSRAIRREREHCCDDFAAERTGSMRYAKTLLALEELRGTDAGIFAVAGTGGVLKQRVMRLLAPEMNRSKSGWTGAALSAVLIFAVILQGVPEAVAQAELQKPRTFEVRLVVEESDRRPAESMEFVHEPEGVRERLRVLKDVALNETHIAEAKAERDPLQGEQIVIKFTEEGTRRFAEFTRENVGRKAAIIVKGEILTAPVIAQQIPGGMVVISGNFDADQARRIEEALRPQTDKETRSQSNGAIQLQAYFFELPDGVITMPTREFTAESRSAAAAERNGTILRMGDKNKDSEDPHGAMVRKLALAEATGFLETVRNSGNGRPRSAPIVTTTSGKSVRIEVGRVPAPPGSRTEASEADSGAVYAVNATGYVTTRHPQSSESSKLIGESLEVLPELHERRLVVAGRFRVDELPGGAAIQYSGAFYVSLDEGECFLITQSRPAAGRSENKNLLLLVIPKLVEG